jgi:pantetheine-phosphate adenylyltransferase
MPRHIAVYPGSFDPMTFGHVDVIRRGRRLFDELVVAVGRNPGKDHLFSADERAEMTRQLVEDLLDEEPASDQNPRNVTVESFSGLTVDFARSRGATVLLRGMRNLSDLQYEIQQALTNREVAGLDTVFVVAGPSFAYTSSSLIRQITAMGSNLDQALGAMVPGLVIQSLKEKKARKHPMLERLRSAGPDA